MNTNSPHHPPEAAKAHDAGAAACADQSPSSPPAGGAPHDHPDPPHPGWIPPYYYHPAPGYAPPGYPPYAPQPGYGGSPGHGDPGPGFAQAQPGAHAGHGRQAGVSQVIDELASGGSGFSSLSRLLNFDDTEFWKGALVGAAAVMLLTNDTVQNTLFGRRAKHSPSQDDPGSKHE
jgi:hypothetical protein